MKKWFLMVISAFALMICSEACSTAKKKLDTRVESEPEDPEPQYNSPVRPNTTLPEEYVEMIKGAEKMEMMVCDPYSEEDNVERLFGHSEVIGRESVSDTVLRARMDFLLTTLLTTSGALLEANAVKDSVFMPDLAVVYCGKKDTT